MMMDVPSLGGNTWYDVQYHNQTELYPTLGVAGLMVLLTTCLESLRDLERISKKNGFEGRPSHMNKDRSVADELAKRVRVLCWVMTYPQNHETLARHVKATWGKRCNKLLFMSTEEDKVLPTVKLLVQEGPNFLWGKTKAAFKYVYDHHRDDADWFLKAEDDTYVVVENLRYMLSNYNASDPTYFGCRFKPYSPEGYMSGAAGYVLSREALERFVVRGLRTQTLCNKGNTGAEDVEMGRCLHQVGVKPIDSRDASGRGRFFPFTPMDHLSPIAKSFWYYSYLFYPAEEGLDCCSDHAVLYHYVTPEDMYVFDYLIYHVKPYGIRFGVDSP